MIEQQDKSAHKSCRYWDHSGSGCVSIRLPLRHRRTGVPKSPRWLSGPVSNEKGAIFQYTLFLFTRWFKRARYIWRLWNIEFRCGHDLM
jgi:hypothetical protein